MKMQRHFYLKHFDVSLLQLRFSALLVEVCKGVMFVKVSLHTFFSSIIFRRIIFIVIPSRSKNVYCLSNTLLETLIARN